MELLLTLGGVLIVLFILNRMINREPEPRVQVKRIEAMKEKREELKTKADASVENFETYQKWYFAKYGRKYDVKKDE
jgi:hypothetical protein